MANEGRRSQDHHAACLSPLIYFCIFIAYTLELFGKLDNEYDL